MNSTVISLGEAPGSESGAESRLDRNLYRAGQGSPVSIWQRSLRVPEDSMWTQFESWQCRQLERLAQQDPDRAESALNTLWAMCPGLLEELAISAVDQEELSIADCAGLLGIAREDVERRLAGFRSRMAPCTHSVPKCR